MANFNMVVALLLLLVSVAGMSLAPLLPQIFFPSLAAFGASWATLYVALLVRLTKQED